MTEWRQLRGEESHRDGEQRTSQRVTVERGAAKWYMSLVGLSFPDEYDTEAHEGSLDMRPRRVRAG